MEQFLAALGEQIHDVDEETFELFSHASSLPDLGMLDAHSTHLELTVAGRAFSITQAPGVLQSARAGGTTGAAVWQSAVRFAEWIGKETTRPNLFFEHGILGPSSAVLELGSGVSGVVPCMLAARVGRVAATDQAYCLKSLRENIVGHLAVLPGPVRKGKGKGKGGTSKRSASSSTTIANPMANIDVLPLDWEADDVHSLLVANGYATGVELVVACDCVYNSHLLQPLVQTCVDVCAVRRGGEVPGSLPATVCMVVQQLRQGEVFQEWLEEFLKWFRVWRCPQEVVGERLGAAGGFAVHVGILR